MRKLLQYISLRTDLDDYEHIHHSIEKGIDFKGTNLWILVFAILVASVGLNMNSTAVVIGAMLISPLMGPINGMGYSLATYDFTLFKRALKNFAFAVGASLFASTIYFAISPLSTAHSELLARTSPTIYDVLIALFGGLAGIVAMTSKHKGNVIPGVAIATALMPPLCTAGYGLATGQFRYFFGAFYLFTINTVFIGISAVLISQLLSFPIRTIVEPSQRRRVNHWISLIIAITIVPSIFFGYQLVQEERFFEKATRFTNSVNVMEGCYLLKSDIQPSKRIIELIYGGAQLTNDHRGQITKRAREFALTDAQLIFKQGFAFQDDPDPVVQPSSDDNLKAEINRLSSLVEKDKKLRDSLQNRALVGRELLKEVQVLFPQVKACTFSETTEYNIANEGKGLILITLTLEGRRVNSLEKTKIENWLKTKFETENLKVFFSQ
jgi:uncharacterized hydrophobic protein (TIGR00271 family)